MATLGDILNPDSAGSGNKLENIPVWVCGVAAGGVATAAGLGVGLYHFFSRRRRIKSAQANVEEFNKQQNADFIESLQNQQDANIAASE